MALIESLYEFFGIELLTESATFIDLINNVLLVGLGIWLTCFICRCLFMATRIGDYKMF